ncbi:MAG TPA: cellulase family glycosylhydrolase [Candidatus Lokiarchaeia archaeon]|nr:cellulase family glycosylhydrolase [Candidatus Lokiarchaeia archaeon]
MALHIEQDWFVDDSGRKVLLRGVNLAGSSKVPFAPNGATHVKTDFQDHREVSFIGRPFPLDSAAEHFARLKHWGFNASRFLVTWEAVEHAGPGEYDSAYLDYLEEVLKIAREHEFYVFIDPHQDVWCRMCSGDGAPGWTLEKVGLDFTKFDAAEAAIVMQYRYNPADPKAFFPMEWNGNRYRFASATMNTLFLGGKDFAPACSVDGENVQDYLQNHFINAFKEVATRLKDNEFVLGFETTNEPDPAWIGIKVDGSNLNLGDVMGHAFKPFDAMCTAAGFTRKVPFRELGKFGVKEKRKDDLNQGHVSAWLEGADDIWQKAGVWEVDAASEPLILDNDHFMVKNGAPVEFCRDFLSQFISTFASEIRTVMPQAMMFVEPPADLVMKAQDINLEIPANSVNESHWYDVATMGTKKFMGMANFDTVKNSPVVGKGNVQKMWVSQLGTIKGTGTKWGIPTLIGETGLPFDLDKKSAYENFRSNPNEAFKTHETALGRYFDATDANLLGSLLWNYTPDNTNEWGDGWNLEDFSIYSVDQETDPSDPNSGGRAVRGFCRPRFLAVAGTPTRMKFSRKNGTFEFAFDADPAVAAPTVLYVPRIHFPHGFTIAVSEGDVEQLDEVQLVQIQTHEGGAHTVTITRKD